MSQIENLPINKQFKSSTIVDKMNMFAFNCQIILCYNYYINLLFLFIRCLLCFFNTEIPEFGI